MSVPVRGWWCRLENVKALRASYESAHGTDHVPLVRQDEQRRADFCEIASWIESELSEPYIGPTDTGVIWRRSALSELAAKLRMMGEKDDE